MVTTKEAAKVAMHIMRNATREVFNGIGLFGSIAREGRGNDINLVVLTVTPEQSRDYLVTASEHMTRLKEELGDSLTKERRRGLRTQLAREVLKLESLAPAGIDESLVDLVLYPSWGCTLCALRHLRRLGERYALDHNIAQDVRFFNWTTETFDRLEVDAEHVDH